MAENQNEGIESQAAKHDELPEDERPAVPEQTTEERGKQLMSVPVRLSNQEVSLVVWENSITVESQSDAKKTKTTKVKGLACQWCDVISVEKSEDSEEEEEEEADTTTFTIHYIEQQKNKALRRKILTLSCTGENFSSVSKAIQDQCQKVPNRPRKLFVLINPIGGNRKGVQIYERKIGPIFKLAGIETTVVTSERARHALEIGETQDFTGYDGIICVSGDGLYQELLEGYTKQLQKANGVNIDDPKAQLVKPTIPFCLIPAGSSNGTVRYTNDGVIDLETSALRVLRGEIHHVNIVTVYEAGRLFGVCGLAFGVGLISDLIKHSDDRRWMKKARYVYSIAAVLLKKRRLYDAEVEYILDADQGTSTAEEGSIQLQKEWTKYDSSGKRHACTAFLVSRLAEIPNLEIKDKAVGLRVKILRKESGSKEAAGDADKAENETSEKEEAATDLYKEGEEKENKIEEGESNRSVESGLVGGSGDGEEHTDKQTDKQDSSGSSKDKTKRNKKEEAAAQGLTRDQELEHFIYLDGEVRRAEGLEFECRLHAGFVPMFGCLTTELRENSA
ncbi:ceramide kinase [Plakobranchus ocellatus]|uniref:Ceramide kinase n=1 Tax=Plakobranchus ocellatus TaxID=259542 RepID=A0AAV3ZQ60_9GAST|nr:ceramide kinase [Plakobranchus ocellatus]